MRGSLQLASPTFVPRRGIFLRSPPHHSNFEGERRAEPRLTCYPSDV